MNDDHGRRYEVLQELAEVEARWIIERDECPPEDGPSPNGNGVSAKSAGDLLDESWKFLDLGPALRGEIVRPEPSILRMDDGRCLFYPGRVNGIHGDSGDGKSWVAYIAAAQELEAGRHVLWVDLEDNETVVVERLRDELGVADEAIDLFLHYVRPMAPFEALAVMVIAKAIEELGVTLVVIDSLGEAFSLESLDEDRDVMVGPWLRRVARPLAELGACVLLIDHATKAKDNPLYPSGSKRKRAAITGASYLLDATTPLTREHGGKIALTCAKDRHGNYRKGDRVAVVEFHRYPDGGMTVKVYAQEASATNTDTPEVKIKVVARAAVRACKRANGPLTKAELVEKVKARHGLKMAGIDHAIRVGALRVEKGPNTSKLHVYVHDIDDDADEESEDE